MPPEEALAFRRRFALAWIRARDGEVIALAAAEGMETDGVMVLAFFAGRDPADVQDQGIAETLMMKIIAGVDPAHRDDPPEL